MSSEKPDQPSRRRFIVFLATLYRGVLAIALGIILIFDPSRSQVLLANLMGFFWLSSGLALIRRPATVRVLGNRTSMVVGVAGVLTGFLVITRNITRRWVPEIVVIELLGGVILLTGVLHMVGQFGQGGIFKRRHEKLTFLLGLFEFVLGLIFVWSPLEHGPLVYWTATVWALVFGLLIIGDALVQRLRKSSEAEESVQPDRPKSAPAIDDISKGMAE